MLLWDLRNDLRGDPLLCFPQLDCAHSATECVFSPNDRLLVTGSAVDPREASAEPQLHFFDRLTGHKTQELSLDRAETGSAVVRLAWHPRLNQIAVTGTSGAVQILFDPQRSANGATLCAFKTKRTKSSHPGHEAFFQNKLLTYNEESERKVSRFSGEKQAVINCTLYHNVIVIKIVSAFYLEGHLFLL